MEINRFKELRKQHNLSLRDLEKATGISRTTLNRIEISDIDISSSNLKTLAEFYNVSYDYLLGKAVKTLYEMKLPDSKIDIILNDDEFIASLQAQIIELITLFDTEDELIDATLSIKSILEEYKGKEFYNEYKSKIEAHSKNKLLK